MSKKHIFIIVFILIVMVVGTVLWSTAQKEDNKDSSEAETTTEEHSTLFEEITLSTEDITIELIQPTEPTSSLEDEEMEFVEVSEMVTSKNLTNLRSNPSTRDDTNVVGKLVNGATATRTGINEETGWSRLEYNGQTVYAMSQYLTTELSYVPPIYSEEEDKVITQGGREIVFVKCDDYVTPKEYVNLRIEPSTVQGDATVRVQIVAGTVVQRTGYSEETGWSRVVYNGEVLYVVSSMVVVTTQK